MYVYDKYDKLIIKERLLQYKNQVSRYISGELSEKEFRILRLQNGIYMQKHAYMLRIAIPYGLLSSKQMRILSFISNKYDKGYGHFTTRQNIQFNWINIKDTPKILKKLSTVEMHSIQTSGNCIRNITSDEFFGVSNDENIDVRPFAEIIRQWSTFHPEFAYLPRKFKIAISGSKKDRAVLLLHDIGLNIIKKNKKIGFKIFVGGGMGRTPILGKVIYNFLPWKHIITFLEAILRVYNKYGRRDNIYKSRIKILVNFLGIKTFIAKVIKEWLFIKNNFSTLTKKELKRISNYFINKKYKKYKNIDFFFQFKKKKNNNFQLWLKNNIKKHKIPGYSIVIISLKQIKTPPGDITYKQMKFIAKLADKYSLSEIRVTHSQNLVFPNVKINNLYKLWKKLKKKKLNSSNINLITDIICCPGGDFCSLANAKSIPVSKNISHFFKDIFFQENIGKINLNISGCINSCGHHHVGNIGILGIDKNNTEWYQISLGGSQGFFSSIGKIIGPSFSSKEIPLIINKILQIYLRYRFKNEIFLKVINRLGIFLFKIFIYSL
ncbi:nitrite/sulfite reductase [Candidatus Zinderia endosymbiont of Aphrophora alni]|uniref:nitrite/sulfite reductase n=1 Tax=Candidatus Zinderia endosymbiont of Aphrophora alni TaxID=3077951 RepID=UPI0030D363F7